MRLRLNVAAPAATERHRHVTSRRKRIGRPCHTDDASVPIIGSVPVPFEVDPIHNAYIGLTPAVMSPNAVVGAWCTS